MSNFNMETFMLLLSQNAAIRSLVPMGFKAGAPTIRREGSSVLLTVPFARYKTNGNIDNTAVYPVRFTATFKAFTPQEPSAAMKKAIKEEKPIFPGKLIAFSTLPYEPAYADVVFDAPIGKFRHEAVKKYDKEAYRAQIRKLYDAYDKVINAYLEQKEPQLSDQMALKTLLGELVVPAQKAMYQRIDADFSKLYF